MINFEALKIEGFGSFVQDTTIELNREGLNIVRGKNGKGKTTMWSALFFCLFGQNLKGVNKAKLPTWKKMRDKNFRGTRVITVFEKNDDVYIVARHIKFKGETKGYTGEDSLMLFKNGKYVTEGLHVEDVQTNIEELLGMNAKIFINSILFGQRMTRLIQASGEQKRQIFEELFEMNFIKSAKKKCEDELKEIKETFAAKTAQQNLLESKKEATNNDLNVKSEALKNFEDSRKERLESLNSKKADLIEEKGLEEHNLKGLEEALKKLGTIEYDEAKYKKLTEELEKYESDLNKALRARTDANNEVDKAKNKMERLEDEIAHIDSNCPTCGQDLPKTKLESAKKELKKQISTEHVVHTEMLKEIEKRDAEIVTLRAEIDKVSDNLEVIKELKNNADEIAKKKEFRAYDIKNSKDEIIKYDKRINEVEIDIENEASRKAPNYDLKSIREELEKINKSIALLTTEVAPMSKKIDDLEWWNRKGFSSSGLKSYIFDAMLEELNEEIIKYANKLGIKVRFSVDLEKASKPFNTDITMRSNQVDYEELSGGQQQRVDICLAFSMFDIVSKGAEEMNILILDEVLEGLDDEGVEQVFDIIREKGQGKSVYMITHQANVDTQYSNEIEIDFVDGTTKVTAV